MDLNPAAIADARVRARPMPRPSRTLSWLFSFCPYELELLRPRNRVPPLGWLLLFAGLAATLAAGFFLQTGLARRTQLAQARAELEIALERVGARPGTSAAPSARAEHSEIVLEGQQLAGELRRPWHEFFDQLETAIAGDRSAVHLVQLSVDPRFTTVQLSAEARSLDKLVHFSQRFSGAAPIRAMALTNYEWRDALGGRVVSATMQGELALAPTPPLTVSLAAAASSK